MPYHVLIFFGSDAELHELVISFSNPCFFF